MQTVAKKNSESKTSDPVKQSKKTGPVEAVVQREINPLWHSMATHTAQPTEAAATPSNPVKPRIQANLAAPNKHALVQRMCAECEPEQQGIEATDVQTKLTVGAPNDPYEQEADRVADQVMRKPEPTGGEELGIQRKITPVTVQRMCTDCEEELQRQPVDKEEESLQMKGESAGGMTATQVSDTTASRIQSLRGGGEPLSRETRAFFEPRFGYDFSQVRVHSDARAADTAQSIQAKAFTTGQDVVFGAGTYSPETGEGRRLLAHELTHVVQQTGSGADSVQKKNILSAQVSRLSVPAIQRRTNLQTYIKAMNTKPKDYAKAAEQLNGAEEWEIKDVLKNLPNKDKIELHRAARKWPGPCSNIARFTEDLYRDKVDPSIPKASDMPFCKGKAAKAQEQDNEEATEEEFATEMEALLKESEAFKKELEKAEGELALARNIENLQPDLPPGLDPRKSPLAFYSHVSLPFNLALFVALDVSLGFVPVAGAAQGVIEAVTGKSFSGQIFKSLEHPARELHNLPPDLEPWERGLTGVLALISPARSLLKLSKTAKVARAASAAVVKINRQTGKSIKQIVKSLQKLAQLHSDMKRLRKLAKALRKVRALRWIFSNLDVGDKILKNLAPWDARRVITFFKGAGKKAIEKFRALAPGVKIALFGCRSHCKLDLYKIAKAVDANPAKAAARQVATFLKQYSNLLKGMKNQNVIKKILGRLLMRGTIKPDLLAGIIRGASRAGMAPWWVLSLVEKAANIKGAIKVFNDIKKGGNWAKGAVWVLHWIEKKGLWNKVKQFERMGSGRIWDAIIDTKVYEFKAWYKFSGSTTFVKQFLKDVNTYGAEQMVWVFKHSDEISDIAMVKDKMRAAINASSSLNANQKAKLINAVSTLTVHVDKYTRGAK